MRATLPRAKEIRKQARKKLRASKTLWKEYKRFRQSNLLAALVRFAKSAFLFPTIFLFFLVQQRGGKLALIILVLYSCAAIFGRSNALFHALYLSGDLGFFMHMPVSDQKFFDIIARRFLSSSLLIWFYSILTFGYLTYSMNGGKIGAIAVLIAATLHWLVVLSLMILLELFVSQRIRQKIAAPLYLLAFGAIFLPADATGPVWRNLQVLPTAWVPLTFESGVLMHQQGIFLALVPTLLLACSLPVTFRKLRGGYPRMELKYPFASGGAMDMEGESHEREAGRIERERDFRSVHAPGWQAGPVALPALDWNAAGWIETVAGRVLNEREKRVADFLSGGQIGGWSAQWRLALKIAGIGIVLLLLSMLLPTWIGTTAGIIASAVALPLLGGRWEGMHLVADSGKMRLACTGVPLSYTEISRVMAKINLLRYAAWSPVFLVYGALVGSRSQGDPLTGLRIAAEILLLAISFQPIAIVGQHSYGTNDSKRTTVHSILAILAIGIMAIAFVGCSVFFFVATEWAPKNSRALPALASVAGLFCFSCCIWATYRVFYDTGRLDTLRLSDR